MTCMFDDVVILQGEDRNWSLLGLKGSKALLREAICLSATCNTTRLRKKVAVQIARVTHPLRNRSRNGNLRCKLQEKLRSLLLFTTLRDSLQRARCIPQLCLVMFNVTIALQVAGKIALCNSALNATMFPQRPGKFLFLGYRETTQHKVKIVHVVTLAKTTQHLKN